MLRTNSMTSITLSLAVCWLILPLVGECLDEEKKPNIFVVYMKDGSRSIEGILKMHYAKSLSGFTEFGHIEIPFDRIKSILPSAESNKVIVNMRTGQRAVVSILDSLYIKNEVYGLVDLKLEKIKKIVAKDIDDKEKAAFQKKTTTGGN